MEQEQKERKEGRGGQRRKRKRDEMKISKEIKDEKSGIHTNEMKEGRELKVIMEYKGYREKDKKRQGKVGDKKQVQVRRG